MSKTNAMTDKERDNKSALLTSLRESTETYNTESKATADYESKIKDLRAKFEVADTEAKKLEETEREAHGTFSKSIRACWLAVSKNKWITKAECKAEVVEVDPSRGRTFENIWTDLNAKKKAADQRKIERDQNEGRGRANKDCDKLEADLLEAIRSNDPKKIGKALAAYATSVGAETFGKSKSGETLPPSLYVKVKTKNEEGEEGEEDSKQMLNMGGRFLAALGTGLLAASRRIAKTSTNCHAVAEKAPDGVISETDKADLAAMQEEAKAAAQAAVDQAAEETKRGRETTPAVSK